MLPFAVGILLAIVLAFGAKLTGAEKDRSFFPTLMIVIATYYVLFAVMAGQGIVSEILIAALFSLAGMWGAQRMPLLVGSAIFLHGVFDFVRPFFLANHGAPDWWPGFCGSVDIPLGAWVMWFSLRSTQPKNSA
ncbi:MAG: hypothetical protein H6510_12515 [Acidobacteria bacterium]|nr:hypothetical protein [Acidobacteriota bacterium]MCB9398629.1 hypothetical protein [Acidobacteriota bacterium]